MALATTTTQVVPGSDTYYDRTLLSRGEMLKIHDQFGQTRNFASRMGRTIKFRKYNLLEVALAPLTEGVSPEGKRLSVTDITATLKQYGDFVTLTDVVQWTNQDAVLTETLQLLSEQYGETYDTLVRDVLVAGTSIRYAGGVAARTNIVTAIVEADVQTVRTNIIRNRGKYFTDMMKASTGVGTSPVGASLMAITHTDALTNLEAISNFVKVFEYAQPGMARKGELGYVANTRVCGTINAKIYADGGGTAVTNSLHYTTANTACDVYTTLVFGQNAYGVVPATWGNVKSIVKKLGDVGGDPLNQRGTAGWKMMMTSKILNQLWMARIEHGVSLYTLA